MSALPVIAGRVALYEGSPVAGSNYQNGLLITPAAGAHCTSAVPAQYSGGFGFSNDGYLCYINSTGGLPTDTTYTNGLPFSAGRLCISTGAIASVSGGIPFVANGAVAVTVTAG